MIFTLPGMLQAMILRSPHAHAKDLLRGSLGSAENPDVMAVVTPDDVKRQTETFQAGTLRGRPQAADR
jgi:CO/xanthine dehydrogenase Mo-binding subunit